MQRLRIDLESSVVAPGAYLVPRIVLIDDDDPMTQTDVSALGLASLSVSTGKAEIFESTNLDRTLIYGVADGADTITATLGAITGTVDITVDSDWKFTLTPAIGVEPTNADYFRVPWAKVTGFDKGRKRSVLDPEPDDQTDVITSVGPDSNSPTSMSIMPAVPIISQVFDIRVFKTSRATGYGKWYGRKFGVVTTLNELWD